MGLNPTSQSIQQSIAEVHRQLDVISPGAEKGLSRQNLKMIQAKLKELVAVVRTDDPKNTEALKGLSTRVLNLIGNVGQFEKIRPVWYRVMEGIRQDIKTKVDTIQAVTDSRPIDTAKASLVVDSFIKQGRLDLALFFVSDISEASEQKKALSSIGKALFISACAGKLHDVAHLLKNRPVNELELFSKIFQEEMNKTGSDALQHRSLGKALFNQTQELLMLGKIREEGREGMESFMENVQDPREKIAFISAIALSGGGVSIAMDVAKTLTLDDSKKLYSHFDTISKNEQDLAATAIAGTMKARIQVEIKAKEALALLQKAPEDLQKVQSLIEKMPELDQVPVLLALEEAGYKEVVEKLLINLPGQKMALLIERAIIVLKQETPDLDRLLALAKNLSESEQSKLVFSIAKAGFITAAAKLALELPRPQIDSLMQAEDLSVAEELKAAIQSFERPGHYAGLSDKTVPSDVKGGTGNLVQEMLASKKFDLSEKDFLLPEKGILSFANDLVVKAGKIISNIPGVTKQQEKIFQEVSQKIESIRKQHSQIKDDLVPEAVKEEIQQELERLRFTLEYQDKKILLGVGSEASQCLSDFNRGYTWNLKGQPFNKGLVEKEIRMTLLDSARPSTKIDEFIENVRGSFLTKGEIEDLVKEMGNIPVRERLVREFINKVLGISVTDDQVEGLAGAFREYPPNQSRIDKFLASQKNAGVDEGKILEFQKNLENLKEAQTRIIALKDLMMMGKDEQLSLAKQELSSIGIDPILIEKFLEDAKKIQDGVEGIRGLLQILNNEPFDSSKVGDILKKQGVENFRIQEFIRNLQSPDANFEDLIENLAKVYDKSENKKMIENLIGTHSKNEIQKAVRGLGKASVDQGALEGLVSTLQEISVDEKRNAQLMSTLESALQKDDLRFYEPNRLVLQGAIDSLTRASKTNGKLNESDFTKVLNAMTLIRSLEALDRAFPESSSEEKYVLLASLHQGVIADAGAALSKLGYEIEQGENVKISAISVDENRTVKVDWTAGLTSRYLFQKAMLDPEIPRFPGQEKYLRTLSQEDIKERAKIADYKFSMVKDLKEGKFAVKVELQEVNPRYNQLEDPSQMATVAT